ncbi:hypothetical protein NMY22_g6242 [Coprinellus aureogranulatus]|nr:hypothetical protein NMY22_g6242 [Coprinellus aureogranulatus]
MLSPYQDHLNTNYIPSDDDIKSIKALIQEKRAIVGQIDEQIRTLDEQKSALAKFMDEHSALISPCRRLPVEILMLIFSILLEHPAAEWHIGNGSTERQKPRVHAIVTCSQVCRVWRGLVLGSPALWSVLDVAIPSLPPRPKAPTHFSLHAALPPLAVQQYGEKIAQWKAATNRIHQQMLILLKRSALSPLRITFDAGVIESTGPLPKERTECQNLVNSLAATLCSAKHRWKEIVLLSPSALVATSAAFEVPLRPAVDVPMLQVFTIQERSNRGRWGPSDYTVRSKLWESEMLAAPSLRVLKFETRREEIQVLAISWSTLTHLTLCGAFRRRHRHWTYAELASSQVTSFLDVLELCPRLATCHIEFWHPSVQEDSDSGFTADYLTASASEFKASSEREVTHGNLKSMSLAAVVFISGLAERVQLPKLRALSLCSRSPVIPETGSSALVEWIEKFGPQLTDVSFNYSNISSDSLKSCLACLPNVRTLVIMAVGRYGIAEIHYIPPLSGDKYTLPALFDDGILEKLSPKLEDGECLETPCYCPKLESFFCHIGAYEFTEPAFIDFVASRRPTRHRGSRGEGLGGGQSRSMPVGVSPLKTVALSSEGWDTSRVRSALEDRGVDLEDCSMRLVHPAPSHSTHHLANAHNPLDENFLPI